MKKINNLFLFFCLVFSIAFFVSCDCEANKEPEAKYKDITPPAEVTNLTAENTASKTVKLIWTNPTDADFAKVVITYDTSKTVEVNVKDTPNNEKTITDLSDDTEFTFTVKTYDKAGNASSGEKITCKLGMLFTPLLNGNGGLEGYSSQKQGETVKEIWMAENGNLKINGTEIAKTSEVIVVPKGTVAKIIRKEVVNVFFTQDRKVKLSPFVMSKYPVTRGLFKAVMGDYYKDYIKDEQVKTNGTEDENPINNVNWFDAIVFCNTLSIKLGLEPVYSYYFEKGGAGKMTNPKAWFDDTYNLSATVPESSMSENADNWTNEVKIDLSANGYRLPTEAEWEFCARGGDPNAEDWLYPYSGSIDLDKVAWFNKDCTNIVGGMEIANRLGIFDMSGNVWEWINDFYADSVSNDDSKYKEKDSDYIKDPFISSISSGMHIIRGGDYKSSKEQLNNNNLTDSRYGDFPSSRNQSLCIGFRLVRTIK